MIPTSSLLAVANRIAEQLRELPESARRRAWERFAVRWVTYWRKHGANEDEIDRALSAIANAAHRRIARQARAADANGDAGAALRQVEGPGAMRTQR